MRSRSSCHPTLRLACAAIALGSLLGCLGSPTGRAREWPLDTSSGSVLAVAAGDVDGDGVSDLVAVAGQSSGGEGGVYLLRGGVDLTPAASDSVAGSFSALAAIADLGGPVAALVLESDHAPGAVVVTHGSTDGVRVDVFAGADLAAISSSALDAPAPDADSLAWIRQTPFGPGGDFVLFNVGATIEHVLPDDLRTNAAPTFDQLPPPGQEGWGATAFAGGSPTSSQVWVASVDAAWNGTAGGGPIDWQQIRSGASWRAQAPLDLDGNGNEDMVGVDTTDPAQLCAVLADTGQTPTCLATGAHLPPGVAVHALADDLTGDGTPELVVSASGSTPFLAVFPDVHLDGGANEVAADAALVSPPPPGDLIATGHFTAGGARQLLSVGPDGKLACFRVESGNLSPCRAP